MTIKAPAFLGLWGGLTAMEILSSLAHNGDAEGAAHRLVFNLFLGFATWFFLSALQAVANPSMPAPWSWRFESWIWYVALGFIAFSIIDLSRSEWRPHQMSGLLAMQTLAVWLAHQFDFESSEGRSPKSRRVDAMP